MNFSAEGLESIQLGLLIFCYSQEMKYLTIIIFWKEFKELYFEDLATFSFMV